MNKVLLVVGNGLSIDLHHHLALPLHLHPSYPFRFDVPYPSGTAGRLTDRLPKVAAMVASQQPGESDYEVIRAFVRNFRTAESDHERTHYELRQYLSIAYAYQSLHAQSQWRRGWSWSNWVRGHYKTIAAIVSFNYDASVEMALAMEGIPYFRLGTPEEVRTNGILIFKPHGSCDFDIQDALVGFAPFHAETKLNNRVIGGRGRVDTVPRSKLLQARCEADIVLPFEVSQQTKLLWVEQGYATLSQIARSVDTCVMVGLSYQECDRPEIDFTIRHLSSHAAIWIVDPQPSEDLENALKKVSREAKPLTPEDFL